ncbi:hypothetical protein PGH07_02930 [Sulfurovum sp. zt1-1]|uniref:Uncharacterized protein n=1 Tax=Sulfurovum zhangzhouensis TaxID=3019067 RepID=A0ABT7QX48_9BACT|nr:hypothetical protein [Sulfurovum zhangzhouensis]MDM5271119.1 hypothetical protein [Sulfurovum zhangzhouensis]
MVRQVRSLILWTLIYRFRRRLTFVAVLLSMVLLSQWIYGDIVEYLRLSENVAYLSYVLVGKWILIFSNIAISAYLILTMFRKEEKTDKKNKSKEKNRKQEVITVDTLTERERSFLTRKLRTKAEILMDKK